MNFSRTSNGKTVRYEEYRSFLKGGEPSRTFFCLDPSSFAATYAGKTSGHPDLEDLISFHSTFESNAGIGIPFDAGSVIPSLCWDKKNIKTEADGTVFSEEAIAAPSGIFRRVIADSPGMIPWLAEPAIQKEDDFRLAGFYAEQMTQNASSLAESIGNLPGKFRDEGFQPAMTLYTAFELRYLLDYRICRFFTWTGLRGTDERQL